MSGEEDGGRLRWRRWLFSRFVLVPGFLLVLAGAWNMWVVTHDHGIVRGRVIDARGEPVAGAAVTLWVFNFTTFAEHATTQSQADGSFEFAENPSHNIQLSAEKSGIGRSARVPVRLYFRSEDIVVSQPLRLSSTS